MKRRQQKERGEGVDRRTSGHKPTSQMRPDEAFSFQSNNGKQGLTWGTGSCSPCCDSLPPRGWASWVCGLGFFSAQHLSFDMSEVVQLGLALCPLIFRWLLCNPLVLIGKVKQGHPPLVSKLQQLAHTRGSPTLCFSSLTFPRVSGRLYFPTIIASTFLRSMYVCVSVFFPPAQRQEAPVFPSPPTSLLSPKASRALSCSLKITAKRLGSFSKVTVV